jgi:hypothetical protein
MPKDASWTDPEAADTVLGGGGGGWSEEQKDRRSDSP